MCARLVYAFDMSRFLDKLIELFKWPVAVYMFASLPALIASRHYFDLANTKTLALLIGLVAYILTRTMMDASVKTSMQVIAHEFAHAFFALLTFHKIKHIVFHADDTGGEMGFSGAGNWLIIIAPYFFPLFALIYMSVMSLMPPQIMWHGVLGYFLGYHIDTVGSQIHEKQTDLPKAGYLFCALFLPAANLWTIGSILAFNSKGWAGIFEYFNLINHLNFDYVIEVGELLKSLFS